MARQSARLCAEKRALPPGGFVAPMAFGLELAEFGLSLGASAVDGSLANRGRSRLLAHGPRSAAARDSATSDSATWRGQFVRCYRRAHGPRRDAPEKSATATPAGRRGQFVRCYWRGGFPCHAPVHVSAGHYTNGRMRRAAPDRAEPDRATHRARSCARTTTPRPRTRAARRSLPSAAARFRPAHPPVRASDPAPA